MLYLIILQKKAMHYKKCIATDVKPILYRTLYCGVK